MDAYHSQTGGRSRMPSIFETLYPGISSSQAQGINSTCQVPEAYKAEVLGPAGACFGGHEALDMANNDLIPDSLLVYGEQQAWRISTQQDAQPSYPPMLEQVSAQNGCLDGWRPVRECIAPVPLSPVSDAKCLLSIRDETVYPASPGYHQGTGQDHQSIFTSENNFTATINVAFNSHTPQYLGHGQFPQMSPEYQGFLSEEHGCGQPDLYLAEPQYPELPRLELVVETRQLEMYHSRQDPFQAQSIQDEFLDDMIAGDIDKFLKECTRPADDVHVFHVEAGNPMHAEPASRAGSAHQADGGQQRGRRPRFQNLSSTNPKSQPKNRAKGNNSSKSGGAFKRTQRSFCYNCKTKKTPQWRNGPHGERTLCNACGLKFRKGALERCEYYEVHILNSDPTKPAPPPASGGGGPSGGRQKGDDTTKQPTANCPSLLSFGSLDTQQAQCFASGANDLRACSIDHPEQVPRNVNLLCEDEVASKECEDPATSNSPASLEEQHRMEFSVDRILQTACPTNNASCPTAAGEHVEIPGMQITADYCQIEEAMGAASAVDHRMGKASVPVFRQDLGAALPTASVKAFPCGATASAGIYQSGPGQEFQQDLSTVYV
eukprot:jgi/Botrbrau1/10049/Bobra.0355s0007.2